MKKIFKNLRKMNLLLVPVIAFFTCFLVKYGLGTLGKSIGSITGKASGSYYGMIDGRAAGREEGLSAKDTAANIRTDLVKLGQLQVLTAGVKIKNVHTVGEDYAALYVLKGSAVFTVELNQLEVGYNSEDSAIEINVPKPQAEIFLDEPEKLAEYQKHKYAGSAEDGVKAYLNTRSQSDEEIKKSISNYDGLEEQAQAAAQNQIELLLNNVRGDISAVKVNFM